MKYEILNDVSYPLLYYLGKLLLILLGNWSDTFAAKLSNQAMRREVLQQDFWKNLGFCSGQVDPQSPSPLPESQNLKLKNNMFFFCILGCSLHIIFFHFSSHL